MSHASDDSSNAADIDEERSAVESNHETDEKNVASDDETKSSKSDSDSDEVKDLEHQFSQLHFDTARGNTDAVRSLLTSSVDVDVLNRYHETPLHIATRKDHIEIVDLLLMKNANANSTNELGETPLHLAAEYNHIAIAQTLLKKNADIHVTDYSNKTPYDIAKQSGHLDIVQLLMKTITYPSIHIAAICGNAVDAQQILLNSDANPNVKNLYGDSPLHLAIENGHLKVVEVLLRNNADANIRDVSGKAPLHIAATMGYAEIVKTLVDHDGDVNAIDTSGNTALHLAAYNGHTAALKVLLNLSAERDVQICSQLVEIPENFVLNGANVNARNNARKTPLHLACKNGHTSIVEILLDNQAIVDVVEQSPKTPFYLAAKNGHADVTDLLLHRGLSDFVFTLGHDRTPLLAAIERGHTKVVEVILKHSSRMYEKLTEGGKKLHENIKKGVISVEIPEFDGRRISAEIVWTERHIPMETRRTSGGFSPLAWAATENDPKMFELMLNVDDPLYSETDIADSFRSITNIIIDTGKNLFKPVQYLINWRKFNVNHQDKYLNSFLHNLMKHEYRRSTDGCLAQELDRRRLWIQIKVIQLLLEKGADFNKKNYHGETPLMIASQKGCCEAIKTLFDWEEKSGLKVDIDARDWHGTTALIKAVERRNVSGMRLLLMHKASVNLHDYYGFTALHTVFYDPNRKWFDMHILRKRHRSRKFNNEEYSQIDQKDSFPWEEKHVGRNTALYQLWEILEHDEKTTQIEEEMVKLLLGNVETDVNARDFRGNTPLDLAVKSSKPITSATFEALMNREAIRNLLDFNEEAPKGQTLVNERGQNPLHLLIIPRVLYGEKESRPKKGSTLIQKYAERFERAVDRNIEGQDRSTFMEMAAATDKEGRTPLHYVVMTLKPSDEDILKQVMALLKPGSNLNAADIYGKTGLHYVEDDDWYKLVVKHGADESIKDNNGFTPKELKRLRDSVTNNENNASKWPVGNKAFDIVTDIAKKRLLYRNHVTEFSKQNVIEAIRIHYHSPRQQESAEKTVWKIWTENDFFRLNRRLSQLKPLINPFIEHLAHAIKEKDWRFECQPNLVGSSKEETKVVLSGDFDFNFQLTKFSHLCEPFPHPLGPKGFFQLRRKPIEDTECCFSDKEFDCFFDSDQCLLTDEVNSRFRMILKDVLDNLNFWKYEHFFQCNIFRMRPKIFEKPATLCNTVRLRMLHPIEDGEGGLLFVTISIDIVACIQVKDWWPDDILPAGLSPSVRTSGCIFVFDRPRLDPSKQGVCPLPFSDTFARISFAPVESRIIKESSPLIKAAYMMCKLILYSHEGITYQLKTCLFLCTEALITNNETGREAEITPKELAFWVERIIFGFMEFSRYRVYSLYFMPSFIREVKATKDKNVVMKVKGEDAKSINYSSVYDIYLDLCPDDASIEIPVFYDNDHITIQRNAHDLSWEQFDRNDLIRKLASRSIY